jgi:hypothetical protein
MKSVLVFIQYTAILQVPHRKPSREIPRTKHSWKNLYLMVGVPQSLAEGNLANAHLASCPPHLPASASEA